MSDDLQRSDIPAVPVVDLWDLILDDRLDPSADRATLRVEIARGNFLRQIEKVEREDPAGLRVLAELRSMLPSYLAAHSECAGLTRAGQRRYANRWGELSLSALCGVVSAQRLVSALSAWRSFWNLLDDEQAPWILQAAVRTLDAWASHLLAVARDPGNHN